MHTDTTPKEMPTGDTNPTAGTQITLLYRTRYTLTRCFIHSVRLLPCMATRYTVPTRTTAR